jgi:REP element-mobilizing transposase RayT
MTEKFRDKYRVPSARMQNWNYGSNGAYFITICTQNRVHFFGEIENGKMVLTEIGRQAETCFHEIPIHFTFVELGNFVVMPNHIHAIIIINKPGNSIIDTGDETVDNTMDDITNETVDNTMDDITNETVDNTVDETVETQNFASLQQQQQRQHQRIQSSFNKFGPQSKNLASIVRGYKIGITKFAKSIPVRFAWQPRYYDHIIRNSATFDKIDNYITKNPLNWNNDGFNK